MRIVIVVIENRKSRYDRNKETSQIASQKKVLWGTIENSKTFLTFSLKKQMKFFRQDVKQAFAIPLYKKLYLNLTV